MAELPMSDLTAPQLGLLQELHRLDGLRPDWRQWATAKKLERAGYITPRPQRGRIEPTRWDLTQKGHVALGRARIHRKRLG